METGKIYDALEVIGWGKYSLKVFFITGMAWFSYDMWYVNIAYTLQGVGSEWNVSSLYLGFIASCYHLGCLFGNLFWGFICDKKGRRRPFQIAAILASTSCLCLMLSVNIIMIVAGILLLGFSLSCELNIAGIVFYEFSPPSKRYFLTLLSLFFSFGSVISSIVALLVQQLNETGFTDWRVILAGLLIAELLVLFSRLFIKETPVYLYSKNKTDQANKILQEISYSNRKTEFDFNEVEKIKSGNELNSNDMDNDESNKNLTVFQLLKTILTGDLFWVTLKLTVVYSLCAATYTGFAFFLPEFLGFLSKREAYIVLAIMQFSGIPGVLAGTWMVETRMGRKWTTFFGLFLSGMFTFLFLLSHNFYYTIFSTSGLYFGAFLGFAALYTIGPESFPTKVRSTGSTFTNMVARVFCISAPVITGALLDVKDGYFIIVCAFGTIYIFSSFIVLKMKETRPKKDQIMNSTL